MPLEETSQSHKLGIRGVRRGVARGVYRLPGELGANLKVVQLQLDHDDSTKDSGTTWEYIGEDDVPERAMDAVQTDFHNINRPGHCY